MNNLKPVGDMPQLNVHPSTVTGLLSSMVEAYEKDGWVDEGPAIKAWGAALKASDVFPLIRAVLFIDQAFSRLDRKRDMEVGMRRALQLARRDN